MDLFFSDNHYSDEVTFSTCPSQFKSVLDAVVDTFFSNKIRGEFFFIGGPNINSLNFKFEDFYIKLIHVLKNEKDFVFDFPEISETLASFNIPTQAFLTSLSGKKIEKIESGDKTYLVYVQTFSNAHFYTGSREEFLDCLEMIKKIESASEKVAEIIKSPRKYQIPDFELLENFFERARTKAKKDEFDLFLLESESLVLQAQSRCASIHFIDENWKVLHCDLHPHNILTHEKISALLDLESFIKMPIEIFKAFSIFKLARKCVSKKKISAGELFNGMTAVGYRPESLLVFSQYELLRRVLIILSLHYNQNDFRWDFDLRKHITGLKESEIIFNNEQF